MCYEAMDLVAGRYRRWVGRLVDSRNFGEAWMEDQIRLISAVSYQCSH
jgi:hypothetical protein